MSKEQLQTDATDKTCRKKNILREIDHYFSRRSRLISLLMLCALFTGAAYFFFVRPALFVPLYHAKLSHSNVRSISSILSAWGMENKVSADGKNVLVHMADRNEGIKKLALCGFPSQSSPEEEKESAYCQFDQSYLLSRDIKNILRTLDGVEDIHVSLSIPADNTKNTSKGIPSAIVIVKMHPEKHLTSQQIFCITHIISSVTGSIESDQIQFFNEKGFPLAPLISTPEEACRSLSELLAPDPSRRPVKDVRELLGSPPDETADDKKAGFSHYRNYQFNGKLSNVLGKKDSLILGETRIECYSNGQGACLIVDKLPEILLILILLSFIMSAFRRGRKLQKYYHYDRE